MEAIVATLSTVLPVLYVLGAGIALDLVTGVWAAWKSGTLNPEFLPTFFTSQVLKKATPIILGIVAGILVAGTAPAAAVPIIAASGTAAAAYLWTLVNSIMSNVAEGQAGTKGVPTSEALSNPVGATVVQGDLPPATSDTNQPDVSLTGTEEPK